jgi:GTPase Era involved in 16S rRNA processing
MLPFVFLLGNHSSGKSSFVNYICQRKVQTAGVAPTDDAFTIIAPGPSDQDRDGPSFIGDPDMGFSGLQSFGPQLKNHTQLKVRSNIAIKNFMIVDTPGMIDSPMVKDQFGASKYAVMDRGYDFENVCRWYGERADVILLFFDPDKPGTTGETLQVLTNSLIGLDHKLHIILNKADQFRKIHDFARAYGALCWNLSKVIQRKDLPRIYTMCLPKSFQSSSNESHEDNANFLGRGEVLFSNKV